jgi:hypothetical protein
MADLLAAKPPCEPALANAWGYPSSGVKPDASCQVCESAPTRLAACAKGTSGLAVSAQALESHNGKEVRLLGSLGFDPVNCTLKPGPCACGNHCSGALRLAPGGGSGKETAPVATLALAPGHPAFDPAVFERYVDHERSLGCYGDEGSMCCPFELDRAVRTANVIVGGRLELLPKRFVEAPIEYRLWVASICRVSG